MCRCICWCPTFVLQIATTRNAVFPYARRGPDTKQTSDAIQAKISIRAFFRLYNFATVLAMPRASSRFFSQALIIERAVVSASLRHFRPPALPRASPVCLYAAAGGSLSGARAKRSRISGACPSHRGWPPSSNSARDIPQRTQTSLLKANRWSPAVRSKVIAVPSHWPYRNSRNRLSSIGVHPRFAACGLYDFRNSSGSLAMFAAMRRPRRGSGAFSM